MIISEESEIIGNSKIFKHYKELGYDIIVGEKLYVKTTDLTKGSHVKILVECDICEKQKLLAYQKYIKNIKRSDDNNTYCCSSKCAVEKRKNTNMRIYGEEFAQRTLLVKEKIKETCIKKYGHENPFGGKDIIDKIRKIHEESGLWMNLDKLNEWKIYQRKVLSETNKNLKQLWQNWDGLDYYDFEFIKEYSLLHHLDPNYPTVDHKTSVAFGFKNNIDPKIIGLLSNLCITKRSINTKKYIKTEEEFKKILEIIND